MSQKRAAKVAKRRPGVVAKRRKQIEAQNRQRQIINQMFKDLASKQKKKIFPESTTSNEELSLTDEQKEALLKAQFGEDYEAPTEEVSNETP